MAYFCITKNASTDDPSLSYGDLTGDEDCKLCPETGKQTRSAYTHFLTGAIVSVIGAIVAVVTLVAGWELASQNGK